jgi:hypothetical protein
MSNRSFCTTVGRAVIASIILCTPGRTCCGREARRGGVRDVPFVGAAYQVIEVDPIGVVKVQRLADALQNRFRHAFGVSPLNFFGPMNVTRAVLLPWVATTLQWPQNFTL